MIVSVTITDNREDEIVDAVRSVVDHVDRVLIVDTGVTDQTIERAKQVAGKKFAVTKHTWVDFSTARNVAIDSARSLGADWIVILDTDERLSFGSVNLREALASATVDILMVERSDGHYPKEKILRASSNARYVGPTHEALMGGSREKLQGVTFTELGKTDEQVKKKFTRDIEILTNHTNSHPGDPRWWYYLGQSLEGIGDRVKAAEAFGQCVERRRFGDEAAWAAYKQAEQLNLLDRHEDAIIAAARGLAANATFAECAWIAALSCSRLGRNDQAVAWARMSVAVGRFRGCGPDRAYFRHLPALYELPYDVLRFAMPDEAGRKQADIDFHAAKLARVGAEDPLGLDRISVSRATPQPNRDEARQMLRPGTLASLCPSTKSTRIQFEPPNGRRMMNPSICWHNGKVWCVVRTINYSMSGRQYIIDDADNIVRTENYLGRLSPSGKLVDAKLMRDLDTSPRQPSQIVGYEDVRLVSVKGRKGNILSGSATVCDRDASRRLIAKLDLDDAGNVKRATVQPSNQLHEKNWMPVAVKGKLTWIYSLDPTTILPGPLRTCPLALDHLRGGAAIALGTGYLCVTHEVIESNETRIYLHRFVRLDKGFNVTAVSPAWVFVHHGIEFCAGLVRDGDQLILSYGLSDREAWIARVDLKEVEAMKWITP